MSNIVVGDVIRARLAFSVGGGSKSLDKRQKGYVFEISPYGTVKAVFEGKGVLTLSQGEYYPFKKEIKVSKLKLGTKVFFPDSDAWGKVTALLQVDDQVIKVTGETKHLAYEMDVHRDDKVVVQQ